MLSGILGACMYPYADTGIEAGKIGARKKVHEFSLSHNAKFDCVYVFGALSNQCKNHRQFAMPLVLSALHYVVYITTDKQNVHKTKCARGERKHSPVRKTQNAKYTTQARMWRTKTFSSSPNPLHHRVCGERKHSAIGLCVNAL